jgi:hypothetical protein
MFAYQGLRASLSRRTYPWLNTAAPSGACLPQYTITQFLRFPVYRRRIHKLVKVIARSTWIYELS